MKTPLLSPFRIPNDHPDLYGIPSGDATIGERANVRYLLQLRVANEDTVVLAILPDSESLSRLVRQSQRRRDH